MDKKSIILDLVSEYIAEKHKNKKWEPGKDWVQYSGPFFDSEEYVSAVSALLNEWLVLGDDAARFESEFPKYLGKTEGLVVNSGSSANLLMVAALKDIYNLKDGDKIIVPVAGFPTTLNPIIQNNLTPVFIDIELDTLNLDLEQLEIAAKNGAKGLMFAHVLGNPPNMNVVMDIVNKYKLLLLEDCCDALGSTYNDKPLGSFGIMSSCSFYPAHHITLGEGGFVATNSKNDEKVLRSYRDWGRSCFCNGKKAGLSAIGSCGCRFRNWLENLPNEIFDHKYVYGKIGYNLKPIELQCSIGLCQLDKLTVIREKRIKNYSLLSDIFSKYHEYFYLPKATENSSPSWFAFPLTVKNGCKFKKSSFTSFLESKKIQTRNYFGGNLLLQPGYRKLDINNDAFSKYPIATKVTTDTFFLGTSPVVTEEQISYIGSVTEEFFKKL